MRRTLLARTFIGFSLAGLALWGFLVAVGVDRIRAELAGAEPAFVAAGIIAALLAVACWSEAQRLALATTAGSVDEHRFRLAYLAGTFAKLVLPMGHVSGPAVMAYAVSSALDVTYEDALAAITVSDLLNLLASILLAAAGVLLFLTGGSGTVPVTAAVGVVAAIGVFLLAVLLIRGRTWLTRLAVGVTARLHALGLRVAPVRAKALSPARIRGSVRRYFETLDAVATDRRRVSVAGGLALLGWALFSAPLSVSASALDLDLPIALALFVVPVSGLATWLPLPGGLGGVELAIAAALAGAGYAVPEAAAIALLFRLCTYWSVVAVAGLATFAQLLVGTSSPALGDRG